MEEGESFQLAEFLCNWKRDQDKANQIIDQSLLKMRQLKTRFKHREEQPAVVEQVATVVDQDQLGHRRARKDSCEVSKMQLQPQHSTCRSLVYATSEESAPAHQTVCEKLSRYTATRIAAEEIVKSMKAVRIFEAKLLMEKFRAQLGGDDAVLFDALCSSTGVDRNKFVAVEQQAAAMSDSLQRLDNLQGYRVARDSSGLLVHYRHQPGSNVHSIRCESDFDFQPSELLAVAREFDLVSSWNKYVTNSIVLAEPGLAEVWVYCSLWMPYPFSERDTVLHCVGADLTKEEGCFLVTFSSDASEGDAAVEANVPKSSAERKRASILRGSCVRLTPLPPSGGRPSPRCHATMLVHCDPSMPKVPSFLVNFALNVLSPFVYQQCVKLLSRNFGQPQDGGSLYQRRMRGRSELYELIRCSAEGVVNASQ